MILAQHHKCDFDGRIFLWLDGFIAISIQPGARDPALKVFVWLHPMAMGLNKLR